MRLDTATVESYYHTRGYFDARVTATDVTPADRAHAVNVEIFVDEGAATKIEKVKVEGLDAIGDDAKPAFRNFDVRKGQIFDHARYEAEKGEMRQRLKTLGYAWADVQGDVVVDRDHHLAHLALKTDPGLRATVRTVEVEGAYSLDRKLIIKHSFVAAREPAEPWRRSRRRAPSCTTLGFLTSVRVDYKHDQLHPRAELDVTLSRSSRGR